MLNNKNNLVCKCCKNQEGCVVDDVLECDIFRVNSLSFVRVNGMNKIETIMSQLQEPVFHNSVSSAIKRNRQSIIKNRGRIAKLEYNIQNLAITIP